MTATSTTRRPDVVGALLSRARHGDQVLYLAAGHEAARQMLLEVKKRLDAQVSGDYALELLVPARSEYRNAAGGRIAFTSITSRDHNRWAPDLVVVDVSRSTFTASNRAALAQLGRWRADGAEVWQRPEDTRGY